VREEHEEAKATVREEANELADVSTRPDREG
jgi:hypothetical protein